MGNALLGIAPGRWQRAAADASAVPTEGPPTGLHGLQQEDKHSVDHLPGDTVHVAVY